VVKLYSKRAGKSDAEFDVFVRATTRDC